MYPPVDGLRLLAKSIGLRKPWRGLLWGVKMNGREESPTKRVIFIVDDEAELLAALRLGLQETFDVRTTTRSLDAMSMFKTELPDCVLLDLRMPGMPGLDLLKEIKFTYPEVPVLIMAGAADETDAAITLKFGAAGYLKKPVDVHELMDKLNRVMAFSSATKEREGQANILFVDEDKQFLESIKKALMRHPYHTVTLTSASEALKIMSHQKFDIAVVNMQLSTSSGLQFIKSAKELQSEFIPIVVTNDGGQEQAIDAIKQGVFDYIRKPLNSRELVISLERCLHKLKITQEIHKKDIELNQKGKMLQTLNNEILLQKNFLDNIVKSIRSMLIITDNKGFITTVNEASLKTLGYDAKELIGKSFSVVLPISQFDKFIENMNHDLGLSNFENEYVSKRGNKVAVLLSGSMIKNSEGNAAGFVFVAQDISKEKEEKDELYRLSYYDALTALPNRINFELMAQKALSVAKRKGAILAFLYVGIDGFKKVNDRLGHAFGDELLKEISKRIQDSFRTDDFVARVGGDEFVICLSSITNSSDAEMVAKRLITTISKPHYVIGNNEVSVGASIGVAMFPESADNFDQLLKNADVALFKAKHAGRGQILYFTKQLDIEYGKQLDIENALRFALARNEFHMVYQPIFEIKTKKVVAMEALMRWVSPDLGMVSPQIFIPIAENSGLITAINEWGITESMRQFSSWQARYNIKFRLAINISAHQINASNTLLKGLKKLCEDFKVPPHTVELELTETAIMQNPKQAEETLNELYDYGFMIAIDDFGQGHSSLSLLSRLPISILKIDKEFVDGLDDKKNEFIIKSVITLSNSLSLSVIAEGIETEKQLEYLASLGCECGQGYIFSKPRLPEQLTPYLRP